MVKQQLWFSQSPVPKIIVRRRLATVRLQIPTFLAIIKLGQCRPLLANILRKVNNISKRRPRRRMRQEHFEPLGQVTRGVEIGPD